MSSIPLPAQRGRLPGRPSEPLDFGHNLPEKGEIWVTDLIITQVSINHNKSKYYFNVLKYYSYRDMALVHSWAKVYPPPQSGHFPNREPG